MMSRHDKYCDVQSKYAIKYKSFHLRKRILISAIQKYKTVHRLRNNTTFFVIQCSTRIYIFTP